MNLPSGNGLVENTRSARLATVAPNPAGLRSCHYRRYPPRSSSLSVLDCLRGLADHVEHKAGLGKHRDVAAVNFESGRAHALRDETFQLGLNRAVVLGHD